MFYSHQYCIQNFPDEAAEEHVCHVKMRKNVHSVKIKQRNTPEGVAKICGIWLLAQDGSECAKIDLCENLGTWRVQNLKKDEQIVGLYNYVHSSYDDEESDFDFQGLQKEHSSLQ